MIRAVMTLVLLLASPAFAEVPRGWIAAGMSPGDYEMTLDPHARAGKTAALVKSRVKPSGFGTLMQTFKADMFRGKRVRMTAWARAENVAQWAGLWMRVDSDAKRASAFDNMQGRPLKGTQPWKRYDVVLDVAKDATDVAFGVLLDGEGAVWVDEFDFEEVGLHIASTDMMKGEGMPGTPANVALDDGELGKLPAGWTAAGARPGDYDMVLDRNAHGGRAAGVIRGKGRSGEFGTLMQMFKSDRFRGKRVRMTAWGRAENVAGWAGFWMRVDGQERSGVAFDNMQGRPIKGTVPWTQYQVVLEVPDQPGSIAFGVLLSGEGAVWVDEFAFEAVGKDVALTDLRQGEGAHALPRNLDFEER